MSTPVILGLLGPAGSGKDLVADWLQLNKNFVKVSFADPMKRFVSNVFSIDHDILWGPSENRNAMFEVDDAWWFNAIGRMGNGSQEIVNDVLEEGSRVQGFLKLHDWVSWLRKTYPTHISARVILQTMGTEWGRAVDDLLWIRYAHKVAKRLIEWKQVYTPQHGPMPSEIERSYGGVVIPDHRFRNEVEQTKAAGGMVFRLRRMALEQKLGIVGIEGHRSEQEQRDLPDELFNVVFTFPEGIDKVYDLLEMAFITEELWTNPDIHLKLGLL